MYGPMQTRYSANHTSCYKLICLVKEKRDRLPYHTIPYSFNNVVDIRNVQQIHTEIEVK